METLAKQEVDFCSHGNVANRLPNKTPDQHLLVSAWQSEAHTQLSSQPVIAQVSCSRVCAQHILKSVCSALKRFFNRGQW